MEKFNYSPTPKVEKTIILVEGTSDIAFLNLYICKKYGFKYNMSIVMEEINKNMTCEEYIKDNKELYIYSVGGVTLFNKAFDDIKAIVYSENVVNFIVIIDSDDRKEEDIIKDIQFDNIKFTANRYFKYKSSGFDDVDLNVYLKIIPSDKSGALETVLMDAVDAKEHDIVSSSINFVDNLGTKETKYIKQARMKLKAKTGVMFSLLSPDRTFDSLKRKFELIDINDKNVVENFKFLDEIL